MKPSVRQCREYLRGVLPPEEFAMLRIEKGGKHYKGYIPGRATFTIPGSPSDNRWFQNWRASFRQRYDGRRVGSRC